MECQATAEQQARAEERPPGNAIARRMRTVRRRFLRGRADESGLTTLEWLLIVAAVAGLAALAVVLVQGVVDDTAEEISGSSARKTSALVAGDNVASDASAASQPDRVTDFDSWLTYYEQKCRRIAVTYSDADVTVTPNFALDSGLTGATAFDSALVSTGPANATSNQAAATGNAVAQCRVS